jgi:hypothetical protein
LRTFVKVSLQGGLFEFGEIDDDFSGEGEE